MKASRLAGLSLPAVLATMLAVLPASPAVAAAKLVLKKAGTVEANGSPATLGFVVAECGIFSDGKLVTNSAPKDILKSTSSSNAECPGAGESISGLITETQMGSTGKVVLKGSITWHQSASCAYVFKSPKSTFKVPGFASFEGSATGKLAKGSSKSCAKTSVQTWFADATGEDFGEPFEAALG